MIKSQKPYLVTMIAAFLFTAVIPLNTLTAVASQTKQTFPTDAPENTIWLPVILSSNSFIWPSDNESWSMAGANPQRTSWVPEAVDPTATNNFGVEWYRPIEAYIGQHVQLVAARNKIYVSTARGLYALDAASGNLVWRFDTELPLGHSPTVYDDIVYVGGFDQRVYALNADTGSMVWTFEGAKGGFSTNPLVVDDRVLLGSRGGYFYALHKGNGQLLWRYPTANQDPIGPIMYSAAYKNGIVFFAANDNYAYALNVANGALVWRSQKMPGDGYQAWWPVIYDNYVIFSAALSYADQANPGTKSMPDVIDPGDPYYEIMHGFQEGIDFTHNLQKDDIFHQGESDGARLGPEFEAGGPNDSTGITWSWARGKTVMDASKATEYLENDGQVFINRPTNKPWRRTVVVLNASDGSEYTFDSDHDGNPEYAPFAYTGTKSGNRYPPLVIPTKNVNGTFNEIVFEQNMTEKSGIPRAELTAWQFGTQYIWPVGDNFAIDEPFANSVGGSVLYENLCCDRVGKTVNLETGDDRLLWGYAGYTLESIKYDYSKIEDWMRSLAPGYDEMWWGASMYDDYPRVFGNYGTANGIYHNHGLQNPIIPYNGRLYVHRSNAIIALGPNPVSLRQRTANETPEQYEQNIKQEYPNVYLPVLRIEDPDQDTSPALNLANIQALLDGQIIKMLQTGHLRPGYYNSTRMKYEFANYFENPGDTLYTLLQAYPYISEYLKTDLEKYIKQHFRRYFENTLYAQTGYWIDNPIEYNLNDENGFGQLQQREWMPLPPEISEDIRSQQINFWPSCCWVWEYPQYNFYAIWLFAQQFLLDDPTRIKEIYELSKSRLDTSPPDNITLSEKPWIHNGYIDGYLGFLKLQELAGMEQQDASLRSLVSDKLNDLLLLRSENFQKDNPADERTFNLARNFLYITPELANYLRDNSLGKVQEVVNEYDYVAPYWLATRYEASFGEFVSQHLYTNHAMFMAKAYILKDPPEQLIKYLDVPAFNVGDLFYIQNLVAVLESSK